MSDADTAFAAALVAWRAAAARQRALAEQDVIDLDAARRVREQHPRKDDDDDRT